ncbi:MerR family transcriptional regulator [Nonomuraea polychroma]|uniref:MerR family transcriptional regulator n=1 Tax=Nonomuraea polychroma TaxID=46176 RepID=UPI003D92B79A
MPRATIKFYLREGLLPPGERTGPNQALYNTDHVRRLKLIRTLLEAGGLSLSAVQAILAAIDEQVAAHVVLGIGQHGLPAPQNTADTSSRTWASALVRQVAEERGWQLDPQNPLVDALVNTLCAYAEVWSPDLVEHISEYAALAEQVAEIDHRTVSDLPSIESIVEGTVVATVLGDVLFATLRRLAQEAARTVSGQAADQRAQRRVSSGMMTSSTIWTTNSSGMGVPLKRK